MYSWAFPTIHNPSQTRHQRTKSADNLTTAYWAPCLTIRFLMPSARSSRPSFVREIPCNAFGESRLSSGSQSSCSRQPDNCFSLLHTRCPTAVVQLPHNCGATAPQLWCNCPTAVGQRKSPLEKQKEGAKKDISPLIHSRKICKTHARFMSQNILASESS